MKKLFLLLSFIVIITATTTAQNFLYNAVLRDSNGYVEQNKNTSIELVFYEGSAKIYSEKHNVKSDTLGNISVIVGQGSISYGQFENIAWSGDIFLDVSINGVKYENRKILSVPKAFFATEAEKAERAIVSDRAYTASFAESSISSHKSLKADTALVSQISEISEFSKKSKFADTALFAKTSKISEKSEYSEISYRLEGKIFSDSAISDKNTYWSSAKINNLYDSITALQGQHNAEVNTRNVEDIRLLDSIVSMKILHSYEVSERTDADNRLYNTILSHTFSGDYSDLSNKPTIPTAQVNSDWNATNGVTQIKNKPTFTPVDYYHNYSTLYDMPAMFAIYDFLNYLAAIGKTNNNLCNLSIYINGFI